MLGVALGVTLVAALCGWRGLLDDAEHSAYDKALTTYTRAPGPSSRVVVVAIDQSSLDEMGRDEQYRRNFGIWPFSRNLWARVVEELKARGARAVLFDAVMQEASTDEAMDLSFAQVLRDTHLPFYLGLSTHGSALPLPRAEATAPQPVAPPPAPTESAPVQAVPAGDEEFTDTPEPTTPAVTPEELARALAFPARRDDARLLPTLEYAASDGARRMRYPVPPIPALVGAASGFGLVDTEVDADGFMRRTRFAYTDGINTYATLPTRLAADLLGAKEVRLSGRMLTLGERHFRVDADGSAAIDYGGAMHERFQLVRLVDVLEDWARRQQGQPSRLPSDTFTGKVVVLGGTALGVNDIKATPFSAAEPGLVKQAAVVDALLGGAFITRAAPWVDLTVTFLVALVSAVLLMTARWTPLEVLWPVAIFFGLHLVMGLFLRTAHTHVLTAMPSLAGVGASVGALAFNHLLANREAEFIRQTFSRFMDARLVDQMLKGHQLPRLDGENKEITAFFSDIRGFSTFSERFKEDPRALARILNTYLTRVTNALLREGACLDKYIGDAVVCLFGAPMAQADHAVRACRGALAAKAEVDALREEFRARGLPDVYTRIGVNSAVNFVGNFGSEQHFSYTAIGDGMNLAARLEGANKAYGSLIMIGPRTYELAREHIEVRELDRVRVAGKTEAVTVYELLALKGGLSAPMRRTVEGYHAALALYREARFADAVTALEALRREAPEDGPTKALLERCREYLENPPAVFDGVANLEK
ncbi:adenylate/guanylate cyclase domain-containing protein [Corallococcus sp. M34]|nr:adenylate/guanylate cyclase domain-containing protein [Citreicoccus inhibens]MBU8899397.1 adenylate/guanylate cyclase domain-containing protein [Citreicoccus inhibens]